MDSWKRESIVLVYISLAIIFTTIFGCSGDEFRIIMFKEPKQNKAMEGHMIKSEDVPNEGSCRVLCYMEPNCVSINVAPLREGKQKCELNNATAENPLDFQLVNRDRFTYVAIENMCSSNPCLNNGKCQAGFTSKGFRCACHAGFTGANCYQAIDCVCTEGQTYFTVDKYDGKNNREKDEIQFEFKTSQLSGLIMYAGGTRDSIEVAYKEGNVFMYNTNLGRGVKEIHAGDIALSDNEWHQVHLIRDKERVSINIDNKPVVIQHIIPGGMIGLDLESSTAYFLGASPNKTLLANFNGCIRGLRVHGYKPIRLAWSNDDPDYTISRSGNMTVCNASDE